MQLQTKPDLIFCGLCRSGNHPIIYWTLDNIASHDGLRENTVHDPRYKKYIYCNNVGECAVRTDDAEVSTYGRFIVSYEDRMIEGDNVFYICRDFLNLMASRTTKWHPNGNAYCRDFDHLMDVWIHNHTANPKNMICYNQWVVSKKYRQQIAKNLDIPNDIDNYDRVPAEGSGSSFIGRNLECSPTNYLIRYKQVKFDKRMKAQILRNEKLLQLNEEIYGMKIPDLLK